MNRRAFIQGAMSLGAAVIAASAAPLRAIGWTAPNEALPAASGKTLICPIYREPLPAVCHKCPMWFQIQGAEHGGCALAMLPLQLMEQDRRYFEIALHATP